MSIVEFKKRRDEKLEQWLGGTNTVYTTPNVVERIKSELREHYQWEDLRYHHLAFIAKILGIEINVRTSMEQKSWIKISPEEFITEQPLECSPICHPKQIYVQNLQEEGG